jgi:hypothetical protein
VRGGILRSTSSGQWNVSTLEFLRTGLPRGKKPSAIFDDTMKKKNRVRGEKK